MLKNNNWSLILLLGSFVMFALACQNPKAEKMTEMEKRKANKLETMHKASGYDPTIPDACTLLTVEEIQEIIGSSAQDITVKDGSSKKNIHARSCFFRWTHEDMPNNGVLVQVQSNPIPEEFPDWAASFIPSKLKSGEKSYGNGSDETFTYKPFSAGIEGAYSYDMSKYFWRPNADHIYMIAFNLPGEESEHLEWAKRIAEKVTD